jgi:uncharacterized protein (TIGR02246 family)
MMRQLSGRVRTTLVASAAVLAVVGGTAATGAAASAPASASASASGSAAQTRSAKPTKAQIAELFVRWNDTLATGDAEKVADLYAPDAVLLPTVSPKIRTTHEEIVDYFEHFLLRKPVGEKVRTVIDVLDEDNAIDTGIYRFTLTGQDGTRTEVEARYTYVYEKIGDRWLIINHHSSVLPAAG